MGQYYRGIILKDTKSKTVIESVMSPYDYGNGAKLTEHGYHWNGYVVTFASQLVENPQRVVWAGDYADHCKNRKTNLYQRAHKNEEKLLIKPTEVDFSVIAKYRYTVNHSKKEYVDNLRIPSARIWDEGTKDELIMSPFSPIAFMCCEGNGQGGGDYHREKGQKLIGIWARDLISLETEAPKGFKKIAFTCTEQEKVNTKKKAVYSLD